ncbi:antiviral RADAR system adenosine deaminase RdrB [Aeromonas dhakensis]|uniref:antiviral RADAR system adenosine deaminase RdrB n=1 Tax=Aeromonas dhakensis TaxID=196024 RepID=UPI0038CFDBF2
MLSLSTHIISSCAPLASDRLLDVYLRSELDVKWSTQYRLALQDFQSYLPGKIREEDIKPALLQWLESTEQKADLAQLLSKLSEHYLDWCGDRFEVKHGDLDNWLSLLTQVDSAWIIGAGYAHLLNHGILSAEQMIELARTQCISALPKRFDGKPIADNHVHLGGHGHHSLSLADFALNYKYPSRKELDNKKWPSRQEHSLFNSGHRNKNHLPVLFHAIYAQLVTELWSDKQNKNPPARVDWEHLDLYLAKEQTPIIRYDIADSLSQRLLQAALDEKSTGRWLLLIIALLLASQKLNQYGLLSSFILCANILRNYMVVSGVGLGDFVSFFGFSYRKPTSNTINYKSFSLLSDLPDNHFREFRVGPDDIIKNTVLWAKQLLNNNIHNRVHFVAHFSRQNPKEIKDRRYLSSRESFFQKTRDLQRFFHSVTLDSARIPVIPFPDSTRVDLRALLRGIDVAGNENHLPIEVFAPAIRVLRSALFPQHYPIEKRLRQPFVTLHAGEDFAHILSGMRTIDEAVTFCDYRPGDRIGHGLAIGINPYEWAKRQHSCYLPIREYLDNLVWSYQRGLELGHQVSTFQATLLRIQEKIRIYSRLVYNEEYSPIQLHQAWLLRRNCPDMVNKEHGVLGLEKPLWLPDWAKLQKCADLDLSKQLGTPEQDIWRHYLDEKPASKKEEWVHIQYHPTLPVTKGLADMPTLADSRKDYLTDEDLEFYEALQDLMLEKFSQNQWVLEACPTSNLYIGRLESYEEHPIFRWSPPTTEALQAGNSANRFGLRRGPVRVCINTDDAGLMPTTLENEHRIIKEIAITHYKVSDQGATTWIDSIRQTGVDLFKSNHLDWIQQGI